MRKKLQGLVVGACVTAALAGSVASALPIYDQQQTAANGSYNYAIGGESEQMIAQTFTNGRTGMLSAVALPISCAESAELVVEIREVRDGVPDGAVLSRTASTPATWVDDGTGSKLVVLKEPVDVQRDLQLAFVLSSAGRCGMSRGPEGDSYPRGSGFFDARPNTAGQWVRLSEFGGDDVPFKTFVVGT